MDRLSLKVKLIGCLTLVSVLLTAGAYAGLDARTSQRIDQRIESRSDELAVAVGSVSTNEAERSSVASSLVRFSEVRSIALAPASDRSQIVAYSTAATAPILPAETGAGAVLQSLSIDSMSSSGSAGDIQIRLVPAGSPLEPTSLEWYLVAIELDESTIAADLQASEATALALTVAGLAVMLIVAFYFLDRVVSRPLHRLVNLGPGALSPAGADKNVRDEIALVRRRVMALLQEGNQGVPVSDPGGDYVLPDALPDVWLRLDDGLNVIESGIEADGEPDETPTLVISNLSELLSTDVVEHIAATIEILADGEVESFEFSVGIKSYRAVLRAETSEYTLEISESPAAIHAVASPTVEAAEVLAGLLEHLPVGVLDADAHGVLRYANRGLFGANSPDANVGRMLPEIVPSSVTGAAKQAMRDARYTLEPQQFVVLPSERTGEPGATVHVVPISSEDELSFFVLSVPDPRGAPSVDGAGKIAALEEQVWALELQIADYEGKVAALSSQPVAIAAFESSLATPGPDDAAALAADVVEPMRQLLAAASEARDRDRDADSATQDRDVWDAVLAVAGVLDSQLGTTFADASPELQPAVETRFHLATLLDEIAIEASDRDRAPGARISAFVQPSLPKSLFGNARDSRIAIFQMIELAQLVSGDRPLILAAMQDTSEGRSIQVRFEVQIPPPMLGDDDFAVLRGCISGEVPDDGIPSSLRKVLEESQALSFDAFDIELVKINDEAAAMRCSSSFEIADDVENDHSWVRGLRTLIIQGPDGQDNGIQAALGAFGIIGYVVGDEESLINGLKIAEEYSNPYRFVVADVDTPRLESFVGQLFDGDAPVVLVGKKSESAMVGAISAGYNGYLAKPVRQVDLLEVIMSTVEPPGQPGNASGRASAA